MPSTDGGNEGRWRTWQEREARHHDAVHHWVPAEEWQAPAPDIEASYNRPTALPTDRPVAKGQLQPAEAAGLAVAGLVGAGAVAGLALGTWLARRVLARLRDIR